MAEFWRALRTLKALQAEQALETAPAPEALPWRRARHGLRHPLGHRPQPDEPERGARAPTTIGFERPTCTGSHFCTSRPPPGCRANRRPALRRKRRRHPPGLVPNPRTRARPASGVAAHPAPSRTNPIRPASQDLSEPNPREPMESKSPCPKTQQRNRATPPARNARHGFPGSHGPSEQMPNLWLRFR